MKAIILIFSVISASAFAQSSTSTSTMTAESARRDLTIPTGTRAGLFVPILTFYEGDSMVDLGSAVGLNVGYQYLPTRRLGFIGGLSYIEVVDEAAKNGLVRGDANLGYGLNDQLYVKVGANLSKWTRDNLSTLSAQAGFQGAIGYRITRHIGFEAGYTQMRQGSASDVSVEGVELGVNGTF